MARNKKTVFARINPESGVVTHNHKGKIFTAAMGWVEIDAELGDRLQYVPINPSRSMSSPERRMPLFDVVTKEDAMKIEAYEEESRKAGTMAFPVRATKPVPLKRSHPALGDRTPKTRVSPVKRAAEKRAAKLQEAARREAEEKTKLTEDEQWDQLEEDLNEEPSASPPKTQAKPRGRPSKRK